jgi:hypothetical protein
MSAENPYPDHLKPSYVDGAILGPDTVYERVLKICEGNPVFTAITREAANLYTTQVGLRNEGMSASRRIRVYRDNPTVDYLRGVVVAYDALDVLYRAGDRNLPKVHPDVEMLCMDTWLLDNSGLSSPLDYPDRVHERLSSQGCDPDLLETLNDGNRTWLERVGGLETMSLYALQASLDGPAS